MQTNNNTHHFIPPLPISSDEKHLFALHRFPLIDIESGLKNMNADETLFITILHTLLEQEFPNESSAYIQAHAKNDWETIEKLAHKMKGGAIYTGLIRLQHACQHFETYHLSGQTLLLEGLYQQIIHTMRETQQALETVVSKAQS